MSATQATTETLLRSHRSFARSETGRDGAAASPYDQNAWGILYSAMVKGLGVSPDNFQMTYPMQAWNWPTQTLGHIGADQYDVLSTIPQWSAIGKYASSAERANDQYSAFLNVISPDTSDPQLRKEIDELYGILVDATNQYDRTLQQARDAYADDVPDGDPGFTAWLGTFGGKSWQTKLTADDAHMNQAQANYTAKVQEAKTPNLTNALEAFGNKEFYSKLTDPKLKDMPEVPNWATSQDPQKWLDAARLGDVPSGTISFDNNDSSYDYSKTWAGGSASVGNWFWSVKVGGSWERIDQFESDSQLSASVSFKGIEEVGVQPSGWYQGVSNLANGPYKRGYSADGSDGTQAVFGEKGFFPLIKTGIYVAYKPSFDIRVSKSTFEAFSEKFKASTGIRIGPFTFSASGGSEKAGWEASSQGQTFTGTSDADKASIVGFTLNILP